MKIGTFVGKETVNTTEAEQEYIERIIKKVLNNTFSHPDLYEVTKEITSFGVYFKITKGFGTTELRDSDGNTYLPKYISISLYKQRGYDEAVTGPCYKWEDGFTPEYNMESFSSSINLMGDFRRYKCKNVDHNIGIGPHGYTYGTELEDLDVEKILRQISNYLYHSKINNGTPLR